VVWPAIVALVSLPRWLLAKQAATVGQRLALLLPLMPATVSRWASGSCRSTPTGGGGSCYRAERVDEQTPVP
jgi:DNA-binding transcriptional regulator YdaS (Cro superfamily)